MKILIPTDFSDTANNVQPILNRLSNFFDVEVHFVHVLQPIDSFVADPNGVLDMVDNSILIQEEAIETSIRHKLNLLKVQMPFPSHAHLLTGSFSLQIAEFAEAHKMDLIVMGTKGASGLEGFFFGSEAQHVVREATRPVLTVKGEHTDFSFGKVLFIHNFEENNEQEFFLLSELQRQTNLEITALQIIEKEQSTDELEEKMHYFATNMGIVFAEHQFLDADSIEAGITSFVENHSFDLLVIGTHQRHSIFHHSVAESLVNTIYKPVLTFRLK